MSTALDRWIGRGEKSLTDLVAAFSPDRRLRLADVRGDDIGLAPIGDVLRGWFEREPLAPGERRRLLRELVDRRLRELYSAKDGSLRGGALLTGATAHGGHEHVPGTWMTRVTPANPQHSPRCVCPRCVPLPDDDRWIHEAYYEGVDTLSDLG